MRSIHLRPVTFLACALLANSVTAREPVDYPCVTEPYVVVNVSTAVEGLLKSVDVDKGDFVKAGQVVATLESEVEAAVVAEAQARVRLKAALDVRKIKLERARSRFQRATELTREKNFISTDEMDELQTAVDVAAHELQAEQEKIELSRLELKRAKSQYAMRFIKSPISGLTVQRFLTGGEFAQAQPILTLAQLDPLHVEVVLPVSVYGTIEAGTLAEVRPANPVGGVYKARVKLVEQVIDAASATFGVRLELPNEDYALPAGLECRVRFLEAAGPETPAS